MQVAAAKIEMNALGEARQIDPIQALIEEIARAAGHVSWLENRISGFTIGDDPEAVLDSAQRQWFVLYQEERDRLVKVAKVALDAGVAERQVRLAEQRGALIAGAIEAILDQLQLSAEQRRRVPVVVPDVLRSLITTEVSPPDA